MIEDIKQREIEYNYHNYQDQGTQSQRVSSKTSKLGRALEKATEWQNSLVHDYEMQVNGKAYVGPHKTIVCLLGNDNYVVNQY